MDLTRERPGVSRHAIRVRGTVQGVGFRPAVYRVACASRLVGFVRNDAGGVLIEIEGPHEAVADFPHLLRREAPPLARIDAIEIRETVPRGERDFRVVESQATGAPRAGIPADTATCDACVRELFDPRDRRYRYPFVNCTDCGPRYTIIRDVPYDRARTSMDGFAMCAACRAEYENPENRRFHAEPVACAACGPRASLVVGGTVVAVGDDAMVQAAERLARGTILALKGLGGYQLAVDARDDDAVQRLRARKRRPHKPFALMARDLSALERIVVLDGAVRDALTTPARPIVLAPRTDGGAHGRGGVAASVAPGLHELGVMLPTTPLHHLLLRGGGGAPSTPDAPSTPERSPLSLLVMTSGNLTEEPIARDDAEALEKLGAIADAFLVHDRPIHTRADDSVGRIVLGKLQPVRRGRGWVPEAVPLGGGRESPPVLAVGAELKNTVCVTRASEAYVSQHIGDLGSYEARAFFEESIEKLERLLRVEPAVVAHDLHPDYASTRWALASGRRAIAVQHHHAHVASCLVDNGARERAIGIAFDGTGCGPAGDLWGGEILAFDLAGFVRLGHLRPIALAGGEAAIREPWRVAVAALLDAGEPIDVIADQRRDAIRTMIEKNVATPHATGAGRWFDAIAAMLGVRAAVSYEAQAAAELEALARGSTCDAPYPFELLPGEPFVIDLRLTVRAVARELRFGAATADVASRFHSTMAEVVLASCIEAGRATGLGVVALSGGCFQNVLLTERATSRLEASGFRVLVHRRVPPNDGGVSLGQAAIAAHLLCSEGRM